MKKLINFALIMEYVLYVFVFLLPWQTRYIFNYLKLGNEYYEYGKLSIYLSEIVLVVLFLVFVINWIINGISKSRVRKSFTFSFLFLVAVSLGCVVAYDKQMFSYSILRLSEVIFLLFVLSKIKFSFFKVAISFVASTLIHAILGIYQFFSQTILANKYLGIAEQASSNFGVSVLKNDAGRFLRAYGGMSHPNILGGFIVISISFLLIIFLKYYSRVNSIIKIWICLTLFALSMGLVLTFSRSAYFALFISMVFLLVYFIYKKQFNEIVPFMVILSLFLAINFFIFHDLIVTRMFSSDVSLDVSGIERVELNKQAFSVIKSNALLGVGLGNYIPHVFSNDVNKLEAWQYQPVHNIFLLILSETGVIGLFMFLLILIFSFIEKIRSGGYFNFILFGILLSVIIISLLDHYFITSFSGLLMLFIIISLEARNQIDFV